MSFIYMNIGLVWWPNQQCQCTVSHPDSSQSHQAHLTML